MKLRGMIVAGSVCCLLVLCASAAPVSAGTDPSLLANAVSATLDLWRENWIAQLYERLGNRGSMTREQFVEGMNGSSVRPACCWQKMDNFKVLSENGSEATVSAKIGLEVTVSVDSDTSFTGTRDLTTVEYTTREFKLNLEGGVWKMQLSDVFSFRNYR